MRACARRALNVKNIEWIYWNYNVTPIARKILFVLTTISFVVLVTNITLVLHIDCDHHDEEESNSSPDSSHCPVCQKLITSSTSLNIETQILFVDAPIEHHLICFRQNVNLSELQPIEISPRGPPVQA